MQTRDEALICQQVWRHADMRDFAVAVVRRGLELLDAGVTHFGADDVAAEPAGPGIAGNVMHSLVTAHVVKHFRGTVEAEKLYGGFRPSKRPGSKGALVATYEFVSRGMAEAWLRRNDVVFRPAQAELLFSENNLATARG